MDTKIVIVGTGLAGYMLAKEIRQLNSNVTLFLVTADEGHFYSKPLLSNALAQKKTAKSLVISTAEEMAEKLNITVFKQTLALEIIASKKILICDTQTLQYDVLILAQGAQKKSLALQGDAIEEICSVNHLEDYEYFQAWLANKKHLALLGSGLVGCEFSNDLLQAGYQVDIISPEAYPLSQLVPKAIGEALQEAFRVAGATWHLGVAAQNLSHQSSQYQLGLSDKSELFVEGVFAAIGLVPRVSLAKKSGLMTNTGIVVNEYLQTSDPHIYALGDCAEVVGQVKHYVAPLLLCARALAKTLTSSQPEAVVYPKMPVVIKTPLCPIATLPPEASVTGQWTISGEGQNITARFYDEKQQLRGFSVSGQCVKDRFLLAKDCV